MNRDVMPRATPVSTTLAGRRWCVRHQTARTSPGSPSPHPPKAPRPSWTPFPSYEPITRDHNSQKSSETGQGHGEPVNSWSICSQFSSTSYGHGGHGMRAVPGPSDRIALSSLRSATFAWRPMRPSTGSSSTTRAVRPRRLTWASLSGLPSSIVEASSSFVFQLPLVLPPANLARLTGVVSEGLPRGRRVGGGSSVRPRGVHTGDSLARMRVIVVGAGIAGLVAADAARCAGADVVVAEARDRLGGRIHTVRWDLERSISGVPGSTIRSGTP